MMSNVKCSTDLLGESLFGGPASATPTLNDLLLRVGSDFTYNTIKRKEMQDKVRDAQSLPGNSVSTPVYGIRGAIGAGLRAIADKYFSPRPLGPDNIPGYRRIGL